MFILTQNKNHIVNTDFVDTISIVIENDIYKVDACINRANGKNTRYTLGRYSDRTGVEMILEEIASSNIYKYRMPPDTPTLLGDD